MRCRRRLLLLAVIVLAVTAPAASAATCPGADVAPGAQSVTAARQAVVCLTNEQRTAAGLTPLRPEDHLERAGQGYAESMLAHGFFAHVGPDGSTLSQRLADYTAWTTIGENLMNGTGTLATPRAAVDAWMASDGHRANLLNPSFRDVGIGIAQSVPSEPRADGGTYAAEYGARLLSSYAPPAVGDATAVVPATVVGAGVTPSAASKPAAPPVTTNAQPAASGTPAASSGGQATVAQRRGSAARARLRAVLRRCSSHAGRSAGRAQRCAALRARQAARAKKSRRAAEVLQKAMSGHGTSPSAKARASGASGVGFASPSASAS